MARLFADTSQRVEDELLSRLSQAPPWRRLAMADELSAAVRQLALIGLRQRHPDESPLQWRRRLGQQLYGIEVADWLFVEVSAMTTGPVDVMLAVTTILERLDIPYAVGGSLASAVYGIGRATLDVDVIAALHPEDVTPLLQALGDDFYADEVAIRDAVARFGSFNVIHNRALYKVDVFVAPSRPFDSRQLQRRVRQIIEEATGATVYLVSAEDIVLAKLDWYRRGGEVSDRQWQDILGVLFTQRGRLDEAYLRQGAAELGVGDLLARAMAATDEP